MTLLAAVIGDIVDSRKSPDRSRLQRQLERSLALANESAGPIEPLRPTVGDEFQGVFRTLGDAIRVTTILQALFAGEVDARFGIGLGTRSPVESSVAGIEDGSAWWSAREAIVEVKSRQVKGARYLRTWFAAASAEASVSAVNAYLVSRDQILSQLDDRALRILSSSLRGSTQRRIAEAEGISQSAVSQTMSRRGINAVLLGMELIAGAD
ncbi:SatD family protein [Salinibacterium soli]|uniref:SatD family protein n=1 Tax=Antiquaquibacter soli TaxID=3064523 RepID=A0ABT9BN50_9MICO|nr:SatD family protein [Protaetiibacter sp. WY-16]MDO7882435.1 SatD family protein [Protaetiibacter sp. WY-16]